VEGEPLRALGADARQFAQFFDEASHRLCEPGHAGALKPREAEAAQHAR
jgi:hypothetical protein